MAIAVVGRERRRRGAIESKVSGPIVLNEKRACVCGSGQHFRSATLR
jgi:hypothetical protein